MGETLTSFQLLEYDELLTIDGGSLKGVLEIIGKTLLTVGVVAGVVAASSGTGGVGTALAVVSGIVAIATIWAL